MTARWRHWLVVLTVAALVGWSAAWLTLWLRP